MATSLKSRASKKDYLEHLARSSEGTPRIAAHARELWLGDIDVPPSVAAALAEEFERVLQDVEDKKIRKNRSFSDAGMQEICDLHGRLIANLRLGPVADDCNLPGAQWYSGCRQDAEHGVADRERNDGGM